jgi:Transposase DDE domain
MPHSHRGSFRQQASFLRRQFLQDGGLPFTDVLTEEGLAHALAVVGGWLDRVFSPLVTLWVFLGQVLSADHSCRAAVARLNAHRTARGQRPCSAQTGAYCQARKRLPEAFFSGAARQVGRALDDRADPRWLWKGKRVYVYDGSSVTMPDTPANQAAYPQPVAQKPGLGFPLARIAAVFSLACGAVVDVGICRYAGKGQSEFGLLRALWDLFRPGDVLLANRLLCSWAEMVLLKARGVDTVTRLSKRRADFRRGKRLGPGDHVVEWRKPTKPRTMDRHTYNALPDSLTVREVRVTVEQPGFRTRALVVVTTLLDAEAVTAGDLARLYRARWNAELDLRSLKQTLQMDALRCKTPELARKELWAHVLAYNLIRTVMAQAAALHGIDPRSISFKGAVQTLEAFQPVLALLGGRGPAFRAQIYLRVLAAVAAHRVGDRPDRYEPRRRKRRPKPYDRLMKPRHEARRDMLKGGRKN